MDIYIIDTEQITIPNVQILQKFQHKDFKNNGKCIEHCLSYYMLDKILANEFNIKNREIEFISGKPYLKHRKLYFSLSHSYGLIAIAISHQNCGIDVEYIKPRNYTKLSYKMKFQECHSLIDFYKKWTEYEAVYKLNAKPLSSIQTEYKNYSITAVSESPSENFNVIIHK